jgi:hypothetical protein
MYRNRVTEENRKQTQKLAESHGLNVPDLGDQYNVEFRDDLAVFKETSLATPIRHATFSEEALYKANFQMVNEYLIPANVEDIVNRDGSYWTVDLDCEDSDKVNEAIDYLKDITDQLKGYPALDDGLMSEIEMEMINDNMEHLLWTGFNEVFDNEFDKLQDYLTDLGPEVAPRNSLQRVCDDACHYYGEIYLGDKIKDFEQTIDELIEEELDQYYDAFTNIFSAIKDRIIEIENNESSTNLRENDFYMKNVNQAFQTLEDFLHDEMDYNSPCPAKYGFVNEMIEFDYSDVDKDDDYSIMDVTNFHESKAKQWLKDEMIYHLQQLVLDVENVGLDKDFIYDALEEIKDQHIHV